MRFGEYQKPHSTVKPRVREVEVLRVMGLAEPVAESEELCVVEIDQVMEELEVLQVV